MEPCLYVESDGVEYGPFGDKPSSEHGSYHSEQIGLVDYGIDCYRDPAYVYQTLSVMEYCLVSQWETIPVDELWWARGQKETFYTFVECGKLNFVNTPFEHNLTFDRSGFGELKVLADRERILWHDDHKTFVPFKDPLPQGYQGVLGTFEWWVRQRCKSVHSSIQVHDKFSPNHLLEGGWMG